MEPGFELRESDSQDCVLKYDILHETSLMSLEIEIESRKEMEMTFITIYSQNNSHKTPFEIQN